MIFANILTTMLSGMVILCGVAWLGIAQAAIKDRDPVWFLLVLAGLVSIMEGSFRILGLLFA